MESIGRSNTIRIASSSVKVFGEDDDDSTKTPLLLERRRKNTRGKGGYRYYVFVALATTTTMMMVAFVAVSSFTSSSSKRAAVLRLGTTTTTKAIKEHHRRRDSIGNTNNDEHHQHRFATTTKRTTKAGFKKTAAKRAAFLRKGKKEDQRDDDDQQQQQATCPQTYVRITDTSVKGHDLEEEDGKMTTKTTTFSKRYDYRESTRECEDVCNENPTCVGFVDDATERYCAFKDAVEGDDMEDDVGRDSYKKLEVTSYYVPHFNKWVAARESEDENAEREKFVYEESAEECEEICTESTTCEAYVDYKDAKTPYCRFKTKDYVQSVLSTPAKDLYSKKTCVPGQPVGKEVLDEFEEKPAKEESDEEKKSESEEKEKECDECEDDDDDAHLAAMKKEAIETFLKRKKETSAMKEAIEAAKAKKNEKSKTTGVTSLPPPKGVVGHSKKPTWVKVIEDDADEGEETDIEGEQPKIKAILTSTDDDDVSSSASKTRTSKSERVAQKMHEVTNFGDIAKAKAKKEEALAYARKLFEREKKVKAELAAKKAKEDAEAKKAAIKAKKKAEKMKAKKEAEEKAAAEEKARLEEEEKKRLEEEEYKKNWAARWMANIEARTEKLTAKKEDTKRLEHASALGDSFGTFFSKMLPMRTWEKSTIQTPTNRVVDDVTQPRPLQHQHSSVNAALENIPDGRPTRDLSDDVALRMGGGKKE